MSSNRKRIESSYFGPCNVWPSTFTEWKVGHQAVLIKSTMGKGNFMEDKSGRKFSVFSFFELEFTRNCIETIFSTTGQNS